MGSGPVQPNLQGTFDFVESDQAQYNLLNDSEYLVLYEIRHNTTC